MINPLDPRLPPGYTHRESVFEHADGERRSTWHGHGLDGLPMRTIVCDSEAECIGKLWLEFARAKQERSQ